MITESSGSSEEKSYSSENGNHNSATGSGSGNIRQNLQGRLQAKAGNSSSASGNNFGKSDSAFSSKSTSGSSKRGREPKTTETKPSTLQPASAANGDSNNSSSASQRKEKVPSTGRDSRDKDTASECSPTKNFKSSAVVVSSSCSSSSTLQRHQDPAGHLSQSGNSNSSPLPALSQSQRHRNTSASAPPTPSSSSATGLNSGYNIYQNRGVNNGSSSQSSCSNLLGPLLSVGVDDNSYFPHNSDNSSDSKDNVAVSTSFNSSAAIVLGSACSSAEDKNGSDGANCGGETVFSTTVDRVGTNTSSEPGQDSELTALSSCLDEFEDVVIPVAGKKEPVKGRVWKDQEGAYSKYVCYNDGYEYKPGVDEDKARRRREQKRAHMTRKRQNPSYRNIEREKDAIARRSARLDPEFRTPEKDRDAEAHRSARQDPEFRTPEKDRDAEAHRSARQDPEFRTPEKDRDAEAHRSARQDPEFRTPEKDRDAEAHRMARQEHDFRTPEKIRDAEILRQLRQNLDFLTLERERNVEAHRLARQDPEFRTPEKDRDAKAHRSARQDPEFRTPEKDRDTEAHRMARQEPDFRRPEKVRDAAAHRQLRQNLDFLTLERERNAEAHRVTRQDPDFRIPEKDRDAEAHSLARQDPEYRTPEKNRDAEAHRLARQDPDFRTPEKDRDAAAHRQLRQNADFQILERERNTKAHHVTRQDFDFRTLERDRDAEAHRLTRQDDEFRIPERERDADAHRRARSIPELRNLIQSLNTASKAKRSRRTFANFESILINFKTEIEAAPEYICSCCGGLWYENSTTQISFADLLEHGCSEQLAQQALYVNQTIHRLCSTCKNHIKSTRPTLPKLALFNGLNFPVIPEELKNLSPLEERLVSLRIPFMQIRPLGCDRQLALKGNVVNVENDLDVCGQILPRRFNEISTVHVQLMRRMRYTNPYMEEIIRPGKVYRAAKWLAKSPLYVEENAILSDKWSGYTGDENVSISELEQTNDETSPENTADRDAPTDDLEADADLEENEDERSTLGAEETLIFNDSETQAIRIAPAEGKTPIPLFADVNAEVLSFPTIYCGQKRELQEGIRLSYTDLAKSDLRRYDRRACTPGKIFFTFQKSFREKIQAAQQMHMRKHVSTSQLTANEVLDSSVLRNRVSHDYGYAAFKNVRSTPSYWKDKTKKALAMVRQLGKPTFFITLSAAETKWPELLCMLSKILENKEITQDEARNLSFDAKADLIRRDPVTCMRHFDHRFRALMNLVLKKEHGVFEPNKLTDYFTRVEFQVRGSPHSHGLYWIQNAPEYKEGDQSSKQEVETFIDEYITTERKETDGMDQLIGYQIHKHTKTCEKKRKTGECRFGFPKPPLPKTTILEPLGNDILNEQRKQASVVYECIKKRLEELGRNFKEDIPFHEFLASINLTEESYILALRSSIRKTTVFYKRKTSGIFVNAYNEKLLRVWCANIDFQFILDSYACARYCVGYIMKSEGGVSRLLQAASQEIKRGNVEVQNSLKRFASILINGSEISTQEAVGFILGLPNTCCSRSDVFINTGLPEDRVGVLKPREELEEIDEDSQDVYQSNVLNHYTQRPKEMEDMCLAEFASMFDVTKSFVRRNDGAHAAKYRSLLDNSAHISQRRTRKIIRFRHYSKHQDPQNYYREQLMLFHPWRNEIEDLLQINSIPVALALTDVIEKNAKPFYASRDIDDNFLQELANEIEERDANGGDENIVDAEEITEDESGETADSTNTEPNKRVEKFLPPRIIDENVYLNIMRTLNYKQRKFVLNALHIFKTSKRPHHMFLSGGAGVGKSHCTTAIVQSFLRYSRKFTTENPDSLCVVVSAPTGKAAFNVFGMTLHCTFRLPPSQYGGKLCDLDDSTINTIRQRLLKTEVFIIDEISMTSVRQLYDIDQRLRQIFKCSEPFGNKHVLVVGHLRQLPPVAGRYVFLPPTHHPLGMLAGNYLWEKFDLFELDEIMRQRGEFQFCKALNNMSEGCMDDDDIQLIRSREISNVLKPPMQSIRLFRTNEECRQFNNQIHESLQREDNTQHATCIALDNLQGHVSQSKRQELMDYAKQLNQQKCDGLAYETHLQVGAVYFVSNNIDVQDGLFNGATGHLRLIEFGTKSDGTRVPTRAWMDFQSEIFGQKAIKHFRANHRNSTINEKWVPIERVKKRLSLTGESRAVEIIRNQIPLVAANGMTIAKSQGSTLSSVVVCISKRLSRELLYVACSRSSSLNGLYIDGTFVPPALPGPQNPVTLEMIRLRQKPFPFALNFLQDLDSSFQKLYFHNIGSFLPHHADIVADHCAMASSMIALVEPHLTKHDNEDNSDLQIPNFEIFKRENCRLRRNSEGILLFKSNETLVGQVTLKADFDDNTHSLFCFYSVSQVTVLVTYKHPKYSIDKYLRHLDDVLKSLTGHLIIVGDVNIDMKKSEGNKLKTLLSGRGFNSVINVECSTTDFNTHIDICWTNTQFVKGGIYECYYSYHKPICIWWPKLLS